MSTSEECAGRKQPPRQRIEELQEQTLSPHACRSSATRGRAQEEPEDPFRTCFQRDRDRILHCKSFRRLAHKTQVFLNPRGDHYRTRITHTLEVAQIARTITRALSLNEDLTEAIALGHDLGHTPFGHTGEAVLNRLVPGGFHHVEQSLRVVDVLERAGRGLNLTYEVREGIRRHSKGKGTILGEDPALAGAALEAQVVRVADIIAYINHDLDDAIRARVIAPSDVPAGLQQMLGAKGSTRITRMVADVLEATALEKEPRIRLSPAGEAHLSALREFLYERVYDTPLVHGELLKAAGVLEALWQLFTVTDPDIFRREHWPHGLASETPLERAVTDFLAGMTDRYAIGLFEECFLPRRWPVL